MLEDHFDAIFIDLVGGLEAASLATRACLGLFGASLFPVAGRHGDVYRGVVVGDTSRAALKNLEDDVGQSSFQNLDGFMRTRYLS